MQLRRPTDDRLKSLSKRTAIIEKGYKCTLSWCNNQLTHYEGPQSEKLCREHQLRQIEYGGLGKIRRPWTFNRGWYCDWCGYSPLTDPWFDNPPTPFDNEVHKNQVMRSMLVGDHKETRRADGGSDYIDNVQTLCQNCNAKKTNLYKDFKRAIFVCNSVEQDE